MNFFNCCKLYLLVIMLSSVVFSQKSPKTQLDQVMEQFANKYAPGQVIIKFKDTEPLGSVADILYKNGQKLTDFGKSRNLDNLLAKYHTRKLDKIFEDMSFSSRIGKRTLTRKLIDSLHTSQLSGLRKRNARSNTPAEPYLGNIYIAYVNSSVSMETITAEIASDSSVAFATPNYLSIVDMQPNDPLYSQQWSHNVTQAENAWEIQTGNSSVVVAVIDCGVDYGHPDLAANIWHDSLGNPGCDFVDIDTNAYKQSGKILYQNEDYTGIDNDPMDFNGHGTHCAGVIGAIGNNSTGVAGVMHTCRIMPVRAGFQISGSATLESDDIVRAIRYAADNGANVISMSFSSTELDSLEKAALDYASSKGAVLVGSAGNNHLDIVKYPACFDNVIAVASLTENNKRSEFSNYGYWVDIAAPGSGIISTVPTSGGTNTDPTGYKSIDGTSMSCPYVAGMAALIKAQFPNATPASIRGKIMSGAGSIAEPLFTSSKLGAGSANVYNAITAQDGPYCIIRKVEIQNTVGNKLEVCSPNSIVRMVIEIANVSMNANNVSMTISMPSGNIGASYSSYTFGSMATDEKKSNEGNPLTIFIGSFTEFEKTFEIGVTLNFDGRSVSRTVYLVTAQNYLTAKDFDMAGAGHDISGHRIVFSEYKSNDEIPRIRCYNTLTDTTILLSRYTGYDIAKFPILPRISMHNVVWNDTRKTGNFLLSDIYSFNMLTNTESVVDTGVGLQWLPYIESNTVVWANLSDIMDPDVNWDIHAFNLSTQQKRTVCDIQGPQEEPAVSGNKIVWVDRRTGSANPDIFLFDGTQELQITSIASVKENPKICGNYIVWCDHRNGNPDIYMYNLSTGIETPVCTDSARQEFPEIYGTRIVWNDYRKDGANCDIYMYDIENGQETAITSAPWNQAAPRISANQICWVEENNGKNALRYMEIEHRHIGDINGDTLVNANDALGVLQFVNNLRQFTETQWENADVSVDGYVSIHDFRILAEYCSSTIPAIKNQMVVGDINGDHKVDINDRILLEAVVFQNGTLNTLQSIAADLNGDQIINIDDVELMSMYCNGLISEFPFTKR